jgi:serine protease Do
MPKAMSLGTGFIIDPSGLILTNNHVVADADEIKISFTENLDEKPTDGEVVGRDTELDVALIRVKTKREMSALSLGDSDQLEVGEYVVAVGNPFGQGHSVTHGIISAKGRLAPDFPLANYIQTDAPINPGNSGGPLVNLKGEVIGINNAIDQRAQGIGFAIPVNLVKKVLTQLRTKGTVSRGYIGVLVSEMTPEVASKLGVNKDLRAPVVTNVYPDAPAEKAGLKPYDIVLEFNGKPIHTSSELIVAVTSVEVGQSVPLKINRGGSEKTLTIKVTQRPGTQELAKGRSGPKKKEKKERKGPKTGMELEDVTTDLARELGMAKPTGVFVRSTEYGGPADKAGLVQGDVILEVDRKPVKDTEQFFSLVKEKKGYLLRVRRADPQGQEVFSVVILDLKD